MTIREAEKSDLEGLLELYLHLHENEKPSVTPELISLWDEMIQDPDYHLMVGEVDGKLVSSVTLVVVKNLTRELRPYALIENVVTRREYRCRGYARALMQKATEKARSANCYKIMLLTGAKVESTLRFYEKCGFNRKDKTAFILWL
ncbi:MAG: GNAT family N-acetyltransferase [Ruminiclostridium sp.]|nr:GNAT family N-acetyltransferase [Ruminiclostridium sp.]